MVAFGRWRGRSRGCGIVAQGIHVDSGGLWQKRQPSSLWSRAPGLLLPLSLLVALTGAQTCWAPLAGRPGYKVWVSQQQARGPLVARGARPQTSNPERNHRPYGYPFAVKTSELSRRTMNPEPLNTSPEEKAQVAALSSTDLEERRAAIAALWRTCQSARSPSTMEAVLRALFDEDYQVRLDAARLMQKLGYADRMNTDPYIARIAARLMKEEALSEERAIILDALGRIGSPAQPYSKYIGLNLEHESPLVRYAAVEALGKLGPEWEMWRAVIVRLKRDDVPEIREAADKVLRSKPWEKPAWLKVQNPAWRVRVLKATKGKKRK